MLRAHISRNMDTREYTGTTPPVPVEAASCSSTNKVAMLCLRLLSNALFTPAAAATCATPALPTSASRGSAVTCPCSHEVGGAPRSEARSSISGPWLALPSSLLSMLEEAVRRTPEASPSPSSMQSSASASRGATCACPKPTRERFLDRVLSSAASSRASSLRKMRATTWRALGDPRRRMENKAASGCPLAWVISVAVVPAGALPRSSAASSKCSVPERSRASRPSRSCTTVYTKFSNLMVKVSTYMPSSSASPASSRSSWLLVEDPLAEELPGRDLAEGSAPVPGATPPKPSVAAATLFAMASAMLSCAGCFAVAARLDLRVTLPDSTPTKEEESMETVEEESMLRSLTRRSLGFRADSALDSTPPGSSASVA